MKRIAVAQIAPNFLDRRGTIDKAVSIVEEAAGKDASLVVFSECFVSGYPTWAWRLRPGGDMGVYTDIHARFLQSAVDVSAGDLDPLCAAAKACGIAVSIGINERDGAFSRSTLFNSNVLINHDGAVLNIHRKLMPTNPERMIHGLGDGRGLHVVDTPAGRVGVLICWENYMPLARFALYAQGVDLYLAPTWDCSATWQSSLQHIAREGGCYVIGVASCVHGRDIPADFPHRDQVFPDDGECINPGNSSAYAPGGACIAEPVGEQERLFLVEIDPDESARARRSLDAAGHYNRCDIFDLEIDRQPQAPARFRDD